MYHLLLIEFLDELIFGLRESVWPQIRTDLQLTYTQIGLLLGLPGLASSLIEPFIGILSDRGKRYGLIVGGGLIYAFSLILTGVSHTYLLLLLSFILFYPASGAFVSLSQTQMMDKQPGHREKNMAKWAFAGSLGVVIGPFFLSIILLAGGDWRTTFFIFASMTVLLSFIHLLKPTRQKIATNIVPFKESIRSVFRALLNIDVIRWLSLLTLSDLMLDVLLGYLTLYLVDISSVTQNQASIAVGVWAAAGLVGDFILIPLLDKIPGLLYLKRSAAITLILFPGFLIIPDYNLKLILLAGIGLFNSGWYSILKAQLYNALPNNSGFVLAVSNIFGVVGVLIPWMIGLIADRINLLAAMWLLLLGPIGLLVGLPKIAKSEFRLV